MFEEIRDKRVRYAIGLTAGASSMGIEAAAVRIKGNGPGMSLKLVHAEVFPYPLGLRHRLLSLHKESRELALLHFELGELLAEAAGAMRKGLAEHEVEQPDYIAMQGWELAHVPRRGQSRVGTIQLGEPDVVAERTGLPVVFDFTARDMAAEGQGRPATAYADWLLFHRDNRTVVTLHLGAMSSMVVVPPNLDGVAAFDAGPCNAAIDGAVALLTSGNHSLDQDGEKAMKGVVVDELLDYLLEHPYFNRVPPKCATREDFGPETYLRDALNARKGDHHENNLVATVTTAAAFAVVRAFNRFIKPAHEVARIVLSGGGVDNKALVRQLRKGLPDATMRRSDEYGLPHIALDPIRFAVLANETIAGHTSNVFHASGARRPVILGKVALPPPEGA
jgi:anhydro-N-acetylmuramic acid kinase